MSDRTEPAEPWQMPRQGSYVGTRATVVFDYDTRYQHAATVVRDDQEPPGVMIFRLDDGRHVLSTECQWQPRKGS